ncbi:NmrA-like family protein [Stagonosporopsis vannaccii]|nr:NmrA-like family protein [Stagonosporopsis vannaccii]
MVNIAIAAGTSNVAQEIIDALVATKKHSILLLSRKDHSSEAETRYNVSHAKADYSSVDSLATILQGYHTVMSFIAPFADQSDAFLAQKNLIDACIKAGVKRIAPSEWVSPKFESMPWYSFKEQTRDYLAEINSPNPILEYCLFQPGLFTNYLANPHKSATHLAPIQTPFDFGSRRMIVYSGELESKMTFTTVQDLAGVVVRAVEYEGVWPVVGGIKGSDLSLGELIKLGEKLRGSISVDRVEPKDLEAGVLTSSWFPRIEHPSFASEQSETVSKSFVAGILLAIRAGNLKSDDTWNRLQPDYEVESVESFLRKVWKGRSYLVMMVLWWLAAGAARHEASSELGRNPAACVSSVLFPPKHSTCGYKNASCTRLFFQNMSELSRKRRAVRKGTRNCWECKRRKVRCIFSESSSAACENCLHRKTTCVSQAYEEEEEPRSESPVIGLEARLIRVEQLLQQVLDRTETRVLVNQADCAHKDHMPAHTDYANDDTHFSYANDLRTPSISPPSASASSTSASDLVSLSQRLLKLWPEEYDLNYIYTLPPHLSTHLNLGTSSAGDTLRHPGTVRAMLRLPPPGSHPVLIARKLLTLGSVAQGALSLPDVDVQRQERFKQLMTAILDTITNSVTTNEELISSVEGLECITLEALIQNHMGRLHQAWRTLRRATTIAQILGLHRDAPLRTELFLDLDTRSTFDAEHLCYQVVCMDRYLSMTLGLPHASSLPYATTSDQLAAFSPIDRMARLQCEIAKRLLERHKRDVSDNSAIDSMLLDSAAQMPHHWWLVPEPNTLLSDEQDHSDTVARFTYQMSHHHLLLRLHMPCILQPFDDASHACGKRIAWNASRKILSCFLAFRKWNSSGYYCRGMDFLVLIALTVLCVSHIDARRVGAITSAELAHSYATDRAMMQQVLEVMQWKDHDDLASQLAKMMQSLLDIEADAARGTEYSAMAVDSSDVTAEYQSELLDEGRKLWLRIPYYGTIVLQRTPGMVLNAASSAGEGAAVATQDAFESGLDLDVDWSQQTAACEDWTLQNVNQALFLDLFGNV